MAKQLNVNLAFTADTSKASQSLKSLQTQLTQLMNTATSNSNSLGLTKEIKEATTAVAQLKAQLSSATTSTGSLDLTKFNDSLKASGMSLEEYRVKLSALGSDGTAAFSQLASSIASAEIPIKRANGLLSEMATTLANTARWQLSSSLLHGFIGGLQSAYGYAKDLNESLNNIQIVTQHSNEYMAEFAQRANKAAQALNTTTTKYTDASLIYYQQGLSDAEVEKRTAVTIKMANASRQAAEEVSQQMTSVWNNFYDGSKSLEYYADVMTKLGAETASSSAEIAAGLQKFAAIGDTVGLSYEYAASALATITATTRESADTVGNALKTLFARIQGLKLGETLEDGVDLNKYSKALETVGVSVLEANGELKDMDNILDELMARWGQLSDAQQTALAQTVAGQRQYAQFMTLMNNADFFQENVERANNAEGSLQAQADIYATSWEAARARVKSAAEEIYDALLDENFFIAFDGFLAKTLNGVSGLIKLLGGLPGVLSNIGALLTNVFSAKIASQIDRIAHNISMSTKGGRQQVQDRQQEAINLLKTQSQEISGDTSTGQAQKQALESQAKLQQTLLDNSKKYNEEQLKTAQILLDQNASLRDQAVEAGKVADITEKNANKQAARFMQEVKRNTSDATQIAGIEDTVTNFRVITEQGQVLTSTFETLKGVLNGTFDTPSEQIEVLKSTFESLEPAIDSTVQAMAQIDPSQAQGFQVLSDNLKNSIQQFDGSQQSIQRVTQSLDDFLDVVLNTGAAGESVLISMLKNLGMSEADAKTAVNELTASFETNGQAAATVKEKIMALVTGTDAASKKMGEMSQNSATLGQKLMAVASMATTALNMVNNVKDVFETWKAGDPVEAVEEGFAKLISSAPSVIMSIGQVSKAFGIGMGAASAWVAGITVAIGLITWGIQAYKQAQQDIYDQSAEARWKRMQQAAEDEKERLQELKSEAEGIKSTFEEYDSVVSILDKCKVGTQEWRDALTNVNSSVSELIRQYPELLSMTKDGEKAIYKDSNGTLKVADWAKDELLRANQTKQIQAEAAMYRSNQAAREAEIETKQGQFTESALGLSSSYLEAAAESISGALTQAIVKKLDVDSDEDWYGRKKGDGSEQFYLTNDKSNYDISGGGLQPSNVSYWTGDLNGKTTLESQQENIQTDINEFITAALSSSGDAIADVAQRYNDALVQGLDTTDLETEFKTLLTDALINSGVEIKNQDTGDTIDISKVVSDIFTSDTIQGFLTNSDLMDAANEIQTLIGENVTATENESDLIAQSIITNNAGLLNVNNIEGLLANAGSTFSAMFGASIDDYVKTLQGVQKDDTKVAYEEADNLIKEYAEANDLAGKTEKILYNAETDMFTFLDEEGETLKEATSTQIAAYKIGAESVTQFTNALIENAGNIERLRSKGTKIDNLAADYAESGGSFKNSSIGNLTGRKDENRLTSTEKVQDFFRSSLGIDQDTFNEILADYENDFSKALSEGAFDEIAATVGAKSGKAYYDGIVTGLTEATTEADAIKKTLTEKLGLEKGSGLLSGIKLLTVDQANDLNDTIDQLNIGPLGEKAGKEFSKGLNEALSQAETDEEAQKILEAFSSVDWSKGSSALNDVFSLLQTQGIQLDLTSDAWDHFSDAVDKATLQFDTFDSVKNNFANTIETLQKVKEVGDTIDEEEYQALIQVFPKLADSFIQVDENTRRLTEDLDGLNYDDIATALSSLTDAQELYNQVLEQNEELLSQQEISNEDFGAAILDKNNPLSQLAEELWDGEKSIEEVVAEGGESLELLKQRMLEWYSAGQSGQFETSFLGEMLASLTTDGKKLQEYLEHGAISQEDFDKQSKYITNYKKKMGEQLTQEDIGNLLIGELDLSQFEDIADAVAYVMDGISETDIDWDNLGFDEITEIMSTFDGTMKISLEGWTNFVTSVNSTRLESFDLQNFKSNLSEVAQILSGNAEIGDTISAEGYKELITLLPELKDNFVQINDTTYQLADANIDAEKSLIQVIEQFESYQNIVNTFAKNLKESGYDSIQDFISGLDELETEEEKVESLSNMVHQLTENLSEADKKTLAEVLGISDFNEALNSTDIETLQTLLAAIQSFISLQGSDAYDISPIYDMIAATYDLETIDEAIATAIAAGNTELQEALEKRKQILEVSKQQKEIDETLSKAKDTSSYYDSDRKAYYQQAKQQADDYYKSREDKNGQLSSEDSKAYAATLREIGQGIAEIDAKAIVTKQDAITAAHEIYEAFGGKNMDPSNIKAYNDAIMDMIINSENLTLNEKLELINDVAASGLVPLENYKEELLELFGINSGSTEDRIAALNSMLAAGLINARDYNKELWNILDQDDTLSMSEKTTAYNQQIGSKITAAPEGPRPEVPEEAKEGMEPSSKAESVAWETARQALADYDSQMQAHQTSLANAQAGYDNLFNTISGADFESLNEIQNFYEGIPEGIDYIDSAQRSFQQYAEAVGVSADVIDRYQAALRSGNEALLEQTSAEMEVAIRAQENATAYGLEADALESLTWAILENNEALADNADELSELTEGQVTAEEIAADIARDFMRLNSSLEDLQDDYEDTCDTIDTFKEAMSDASGETLADMKTNDKFSKSLGKLEKGMCGILDVSEDLAGSKWMEDFLNEADEDTLKKAIDGDADAIKELRNQAADKIVLDAQVTGQEEIDNFRDKIADLAEGDYVPRIDIEGNVDPFLDALNQALQAGILTTEDIENIFGAMDMVPNFGPVEEAFNQVASEAGPAAAAMADNYAGSGGVDAQVNQVTAEQSDTKENVGFTEEISFSEATATGKAISASGTETKETDISVSYPVATKTVTANPVTETATEQSTGAGIELKGATKSSGGNVGTSHQGGGSSGGGGGCFIAGTLISTSSGFKRIENIAIGDIVLSYNEKKKQNEYSEVVQTMIHILNEPIYTLYIENEKLEVTGIHRFYIVRNNKNFWIPASDLQVGDFVLFANGTLHKINKITVDIRFIPVYNFEVSGNHNYYVGVNQILAHNKGGGGRRPRGGSGRQERPRTRTVSKKAAQVIDSKDEKERYHVLNNQLEDLEKQYDKIDSAKERAYGKSKLSLMDAEIKKQEQIIAKQKEYLKEVEKNIKLDKLALKGGKDATKESKELAKAKYVTTSEKITKDSKGNKVVTTEEKNASAAADSKSFLGIDAKFDANGTLTNYDQLIEAKVAKLNAAYAELAKYTDEDLKYRDQEEGESDKDYKKWQKRHAAALEAQNAVAKVEAQAAQWDKLLDQYEESQDLYWEKQNEILEAEYKRMSAMLEKDKYKLQIKIDIEDEGLERLEFLLGRIGDRAEKAAAAIANLGKQAKASADKSAAYEKSLIDFFGEKTNKMKVIGTDKDTGAKIYGNDESSGRLDGKAIVDTLRKGGKEAEELIKTLGKRPDFDEEWLEAISESIKGMMEEAESMQEKVNDAFERMRDVYEEMQERMDKVIDRQKKIKELSQGYLDVIDIIGRQRTGMTSEKEYDIQKKIYEQQRNIARAARTQLEATKAQKVEAQSGLDNAKKQVTQLEKLKKYAEDYQKSQKNTTKEIQEQAKAQSKAVKDNASSQKKAAQDMAKGELSAVEQKLKEYQKIEEKYSKQADENRLKAQDYKTLAKAAKDKNKKAKSQKYTSKSNEFLALADSQDNQARQAKNMVESLTKQKQEIQARLNKTITDIDASTNKQLDNIEKKAQKKIEDSYNNSINKKAKSLGIQNWDEVVKHSQSAGEASVATPEEIQGMIDTWQEDVYKWQDTVDEIDTEILDQTREVQEEFTMTVEEAYKLFETGMQGIIRDFNSAVSGASGTIDALQHAFERFNQANSTYVEDYEKVYRLQKLNLGLQQDIDKASNPKAKRELLQLQEKINEAYESGNKLSEYQIQMMEKERDLLVAKAEFEDAQNAKSKVSLTRDNEGNVGYVYTADPTDVAAAEENYNAKIYEMRKLNAEYIEELQQQLMDLDAAYTADMENLYQNFEIGSEAYFTELTRIQDDYRQSYQNVFDQFGVAIDDSKHINEDYVNTYVALTGDQKSADIEYIKSFDETTYSKLTGFTTMQEAHDAHVDAMQEAWGRANEYTDDFMENTKEDFEEAGYDINNYGDTAETEISKLGEESDLLKEKMEQIATETKELFSAAVEALKTMEKEMDDIIGKISAKCKTLGDAITAVKNRLAGFEEQISEGEKEPDKPRRTDDRRTGDRRTGDRRTGGGRRGGGRGDRGRRSLSQKDKDGLALAIWNGNYGWSNDPVRHQRLVASGLTDQQAWDVQANVNRMGREGLVHSGAWYGHYSGITDFSKWRYGSWHLKSGGYTGQWSADENEGRWAVLHQKELVLNKEDTANMLSAVDILRQISSTINLNALAAAGGLSSGVSAGGVGTNSRDLNQHVEISASFPNATDRNEISAAFENLIGLASQYANR